MGNVVSCGKSCGKACGKVVESLRIKSWRSRKMLVRVVRVCGNLFGFVEACSGFGDFVREICGKVLLGRIVEEAALSTVSTYPITTTTNLLRKERFNHTKEELWN